MKVRLQVFEPGLDAPAQGRSTRWHECLRASGPGSSSSPNPCRRNQIFHVLQFAIELIDAEGGCYGNDDCRHKVGDYGQWRPIFDRHAEMQKAAGLIDPRVYHSADSNKSEIVVVFDTEDTKKAKDFAASADLKEAMEKAGVLDTPTIYFLESID